jgi:hypothetical protein
VEEENFIEIRGVECFKQSQMYINGVLIEAWKKLKSGDLSGARLDRAKVETVVVFTIESYKIYIERRGDNIVVRLFTCTGRVVYLKYHYFAKKTQPSVIFHVLQTLHNNTHYMQTYIYI